MYIFISSLIQASLVHLQYTHMCEITIKRSCHWYFDDFPSDEDHSAICYLNFFSHIFNFVIINMYF